MSRYDLLLVLHLVAVIVWLGAGFLLAVLVFGAERAGDLMREAGYHRDTGWLAPRLFIPASMSTLIFGALLVIDGPYQFSDPWIAFALAGWFVSFGLGFFYFKPEGERIGRLVEARGPADPEIARRVRRVNIVDRAQVLILFLVVADMVLKPGSDDTGIIVALVAVALAGVVAAAAGLQREASADPVGRAAGTA